MDSSEALEAPRDFRFGLRISLIFHLSILLFFIVGNEIFPTNQFQTLPPVLRVDLVDLPDQLKNEAVLPSPADSAPPDTASSKKVKTEAPDPDELTLKSKKKIDASADRKKKIQSALQRLKSLEKIQDMEKQKPTPKTGTVVKGNKISKGTSLSADAVEAMQSGYMDLIRDRLQGNWELPIWLSRQGLSAQVLIFIDSTGTLRGMKFLKSSGNSQFDDAVRNTIQASSPYPRPPDELAGQVAHGIPAGFPL